MVQFAHVMQTAEPRLRVGLSMDVIFVKQACGDISACLKEHCFHFTVHLGSEKGRKRVTLLNWGLTSVIKTTITAEIIARMQFSPSLSCNHKANMMNSAHCPAF